MSLTTVPVQVRDLFVQEWLACSLRTYPVNTGRFLRQERDPFRNPVGSTLRAALEELGVQLFGAFDRARVTASIDAIVRIRAVQDFTPAEAVAFVPLAAEAVRAAASAGGATLDPAAMGLLDARIGAMAAIAGQVYGTCCDQIREIGARAERRRVFVPERARDRSAKRAAAPLPPRGTSA